MATGLKTDMVIYDREFFGGMNELLTQNFSVFNEASGGALRMVTRDILGDFEKESFLKNLANNIRHRDVTSSSSVTPNKMTEGEFVGIKVNKGFGPTDMALDAWRKQNLDPSIFSFNYGQQVGQAVMSDYVNTATLVARTTIEAQSGSLVYDATGEANPTMQHKYMIRGLKNFGDRGQRIGAWVMHSVPFYELMENATIEKITNVADAVVYGGVPGSFDRPIIVTDSDSLVDDSNPSNLKYYTLGLVNDAVEVAQSEDETVWSDPQTGQENLVMRIQGEYAFNVRAKGYAFTGSANPNDAALGTAGNWAYRMQSHKDAPGIAIVTSESTVT